MFIGFMRRFTEPTTLAKFTAMLCKSQGLDLIYLRPKDVDMTNNRVNGKMLKNNKWKKVHTKLPTVIDISPNCFKKKNKTIMDYLRTNTTITYDRENSVNKERLQRELKKDENFAHLVIPTKVLQNFSDIEYFLNQYTTIVMKPINSEQGKGIFILKKEHSCNEKL